MSRLIFTAVLIYVAKTGFGQVPEDSVFLYRLPDFSYIGIRNDFHRLIDSSGDTLVVVDRALLEDDKATIFGMLLAKEDGNSDGPEDFHGTSILAVFKNSSNGPEYAFAEVGPEYGWYRNVFELELTNNVNESELVVALRSGFDTDGDGDQIDLSYYVLTETGLALIFSYTVRDHSGADCDVTTAVGNVLRTEEMTGGYFDLKIEKTIESSSNCDENDTEKCQRNVIEFFSWDGSSYVPKGN